MDNPIIAAVGLLILVFNVVDALVLHRRLFEVSFLLAFGYLLFGAGYGVLWILHHLCY